MTDRIHIVGRKNSGKTTLIVDLVRQLSARGLRVATIKHTHHHHELDTPGKDSHRHREAGAAMIGIMAPGANALFWSPEEDESERYNRMMTMFTDCDMVLMEGGLTGPGTKIEVWREVLENEPLARDDDSIIAVVSDDAPDVQIPIWSRADVEALADRLIRLSVTP